MHLGNKFLAAIFSVIVYFSNHEISLNINQSFAKVFAKSVMDVEQLGID